MIGCLQLAAALLLLGAGGAKLRNPTPAVAMVRRVWRSAPTDRTGRLLLRVVAVAEVAVGVFALAAGSRLAAALLAACYLGFLAVAGRLLITGDRGSCGCFGAAPSPVGAGHLAVNTAAVGVAIAALVHPPGPVTGLFDAGALAGLVAVGQAVLLAYLAFLSITALPGLLAARRQLLEVS